MHRGPHKPNGKNSWPRETENVQDEGREVLSALDELRKVAASPDRWKLFQRAEPADEYLVLLSEAKILRTQGLKETGCQMDWKTGEAVCQAKGEAVLDCRNSWCPFAALMRMRLVHRLRGAYARERKRLVVR